MKLNIPSKICLSLKEINFDNLETYKQITNVIEIRLDFISLNINQLIKLADTFELIILKITDIGYNLIKLLDNINNKSREKILLDIDYNLLSNNHNRDTFNQFSSYKILISLHNIKLIHLKQALYELTQKTKFINPLLFKFVINEAPKNNLLQIMNDSYSISVEVLKKNNSDIILFFEGVDFTLTRYYSLKMGAPFIYCAFDESSKTGIGQPTFLEAQKYISENIT